MTSEATGVANTWSGPALRAGGLVLLMFGRLSVRRTCAVGRRKDSTNP
ncbi:hypothetical protein LMG28614_02748 [Paraburkholderia ultramafica]|uniref:Uncharacterized protein n=1 Tax=Paraburkholderia ultramafica TaxID=1544867 RepID=A0A6S7BEV3_9BURK|nr:hypothetical protein LMG28614_02748 [Paraburkholderia ultramafica]